jgi:hypothetical protein
MKTHHTTVSQRKVAQVGKAYTDTWLGTQVVFTSYEGDRTVGTITRWDDLYPVATFPNGSWARLDLSVEVVDEPTEDYFCCLDCYEEKPMTEVGDDQTRPGLDPVPVLICKACANA